MTKVANCRASWHIKKLLEFINHTGTLYGKKVGLHGYAVYSYGPHFPLAFHNGKFWLLNTGNYWSQTTKKQSNICREACVNYVGCNTAFIINAIDIAKNEQ